MSRTNEVLNISLLRSNKGEFVLRCQPIIRFIVQRYTASGMFKANNVPDIIQTVNEKLIKRLTSTENNFDGSVLMATYINVVIRNICLRIHERERAAVKTISLTEINQHSDDDNDRALMIEEEIQRLELAMKLCGTQRFKILVCMKVYFRLSITKNEIMKCFNDITEMEKQTLSNRFGGIYDDSFEIENFNLLAVMINKKENKNTSGNSTRRWTEENIRKVLILLNGDPPNRTHTRETLKFLLEHCSLK